MLLIFLKGNKSLIVADFASLRGIEYDLLIFYGEKTWKMCYVVITSGEVELKQGLMPTSGSLKLPKAMGIFPLTLVSYGWGSTCL